MDIMDIMVIMEFMDIIDIMDVLDIMGIMDIMDITTWMAMAGTILALVIMGILVLIAYVVFTENKQPGSEMWPKAFLHSIRKGGRGSRWSDSQGILWMDSGTFLYTSKYYLLQF